MCKINVAIDGPAGAGKSTIARRVSKELGYIYVDTGALYRTVGVSALRKKVDMESDEAIASVLPETEVEMKFVDGEQKMYLNGEDVSVEIRLPEASMAASRVSAVPAVRDFLFDLQRDLARKNNCIMDGRDIGTVVLPDAQVKIFLTASPECRADRRYKELTEKGVEVNYDDVLSDIIKRDYNDSHRAVAPLKPAEDSVILDTSGFELEQSVKAIKDIIKEKIG
ncbi:MAG: (d)CMP kinase [Ruminococcaceae bacterium]|nr:(d)CMP kinase [Oscillospiraceae bacterium]MBQ6873314.1 (d)CMP kinase [Clostridia bacterium]